MDKKIKSGENMFKDFNVLDENNYYTLMESTVKPYLKKIEHLGKFSSFDGNDIFYRYYLNENAKGNLVVVHGFTENSEKFLEMIYYFHLGGYNVFSYDQRGHGYSYREVEDTSISHINRFDEYVNDLECYRELHGPETPIAHCVSKNILTLPMYEELALEDVDRICDIILK